MKTCPFCGKQIEETTKDCKYCGKDLIQDPLEIREEKRNILIKDLAESNKALADSEIYLNEETLYGQKQEKIWFEIGWIIIGSFVPFGIFIIVSAVISIIIRLVKRFQSGRLQSEAKLEIETLHNQILNIKAELSTLDEISSTDGDLIQQG